MALQPDYKKARRTISKAMTTTTTTTVTTAAAAAAMQGTMKNTHDANNDDGLVWTRLQQILQHPNCQDTPSGPSHQENQLLARVTEFGITPYKYEVPLGNGVSDCVGYDMDHRLCVVEAKCMFLKKNTPNNKQRQQHQPTKKQQQQQQNYNSIDKRRAKVIEQTTAYATYLSKATQSNVAAYSFDDQNGMIALHRFGIVDYHKVKHYDPRGGNKNKQKHKHKKKQKPPNTGRHTKNNKPKCRAHNTTNTAAEERRKQKEPATRKLKKITMKKNGVIKKKAAPNKKAVATKKKTASKKKKKAVTKKKTAPNMKKAVTKKKKTAKK